ncbi:hypothetical protein ACFOWZ_27235 [Lentzea rhizosphaerae]|uniref:Virginiamycin B lyase n=1 Tax=Lentzea rhizosphaerae TaxID=2041025 RepID=A0ABV8BZU2_9PSEU
MARLILLLIGLLLAGCTTSAQAPPEQETTPEARQATITAVQLPKGSFPRLPFVAPDGIVWCSESSGESIARIDKNGAITHLRIPGSSNSPAGIVRGPDGLIWFAGFQLIGKISAEGTLSGWRTGRGVNLGLPNAITTGPDNAVWYTNEKVPPAISRISTSGALRHTTVQTDDKLAKLPGITTGPDQALWFTLSSNAKGAKHSIGRMPTDGNPAKLWPLPGEASPGRIVTGPDSALWFTMARGIGRMTVDGNFTEYAVPDDARPSDLAASPDSALWFTTDQARIGRITTSGQVTLHAVDGAQQLTGIAAAPDSTLWIADGKADTVWHYSPAG